MIFLQHFQETLTQRGFQADRSQLVAAQRLNVFCDELAEFRRARSNALKKMIHRGHVPRGVYCWGGVGRGKSFLMDSFFEAVPIKRKLRIHFHEFMRGVHIELNSLKGEIDPLITVAQRVSKRYRLICFDEFHVSDIADAMILYRLLAALFENGTTFVMTSNYHPDALYPEGLHRERVLPAIDLLKAQLDVLNVDAGLDYRKRTLDQLQVYLSPITEQTSVLLTQAFENLVACDDESPFIIIETREIEAVRRAGSVAWFDFAKLCGTPRSQNDYLELASQFQTIIVSDVPQMFQEQYTEARRFTWLVDVLYDHAIKLIVSAQVAPEHLYPAGSFAQEFTRTASRLIEMQSMEYRDLPKRAVTQSIS